MIRKFNFNNTQVEVLVADGQMKELLSCVVVVKARPPEDIKMSVVQNLFAMKCIHRLVNKELKKEVKHASKL